MLPQGYIYIYIYVYMHIYMCIYINSTNIPLIVIVNRIYIPNINIYIYKYNNISIYI